MTATLDKNLLVPVECTDLIRLGQQCDGGYVVPAIAVDRTTVLLSLGLNDEWSFDRDFIARNRGARVIGVDHSVAPAFFVWRWLRGQFKTVLHGLLGHAEKSRRKREVAQKAASYFTFFRAPNSHLRKMVSGTSGEGRITVAELMRLAGPLHPLSVFLKIDIEGAEYDIVDDVLHHAGGINCIAVEFHDLDVDAARLNRSMRRLLEAFHVVHVHGNNFDGLLFDGFPRGIEVTLLNKQLLPTSPLATQKTYPLAGLDAVNFPDRPDVPIRFH